MTVYRKDLSPAEVRELLDYDPETGEFTYRTRPGDSHSDVTFNARFAGRKAGSFNHGYWRVKIRSIAYSGHRLAWVWMKGEWPTEDVDHKNTLKGDNRFDNLRPATRGQNVANVGLMRHNKVGLKGVCWKPRQGRHGKYHAQITYRQKVHHLGFYDNPEAAHAAYVRAAQEMHGEFARTE